MLARAEVSSVVGGMHGQSAMVQGQIPFFGNSASAPKAARLARRSCGQVANVGLSMAALKVIKVEHQCQTT